MIAPAAPMIEQIQSEFEAMSSELAGRFRCRFYDHGPESQAERTAEALALACAAFRSARLKDKRVSVANLAWYAIRTVSSGRRLADSSTLDVMSDRRQTRRKAGLVVSLSDPDANGTVGSPYDLIVDRRWKWPIVEYVGADLDWRAFIRHCHPRDQQIAVLRKQGYELAEIGTILGISGPAVCQRWNGLRRRWDSMSAMPA